MTVPALSALQRSLSAVGLRILHVGTAAVAGAPFTRGSVILVGQVGSAVWQPFTQSPEYGDGAPDPLDRWSRRVIGACAPGLAYFNPSDGPPFLPLTALTRGGSFSASPLGLQIHATFGLWTAFRGVLYSEADLPASRGLPAPDPSVFTAVYGACPGGTLPPAGGLDALASGGLDALACGKNLLADPHAPCWHGCLARRACSLGQEHAYKPDHARFHALAYAQGVERRLKEGLAS